MNLQLYVAERLPNRYMLRRSDIEWLDIISDFWNGSTKHSSILKAVSKAIKWASEYNETEFLIDPYELFVDAKICKPNLKPTRN